MPWPRLALRALLPFAVHGLARGVDAGIGLLLHSSLAISYPLEVARLVGAGAPAIAASVAVSTLIGLGAWLGLAALRARAAGLTLGEAAAAEAGSFAPLYVRPAMTGLALLSLGLDPVYPYAFTLPVALTQDWGPAQDAFAAAWWIAARARVPRLPAPSARAVFFMCFVAYALLTPEWARQWEGHPGNEPKYLRQGVALGHELSFDAEGVSAPMEELQPAPLADALGRGASTLLGETAAMVRALAEGPSAVGKDAIRASRITRQTIAGKDGGVYYVLAPGPSLLLAPTLRIDRAVNRARGTPGRLAASVLAWNALGALLVAALFRLVRETTGRTGLSAALAAAFALVPPCLFYFFQFYPEMVGALLLAAAFRWLAFVRPWPFRTALAFSAVLFALPWLHQKFLPVWGVLTLTAFAVAWRSREPRSVWFALAVPQVLGLFLTALYNFAITGSVRPDALFLAWGPAGITTARIGQGLFGLWFDARYGLLPCAPVYVLAGAGLVYAVRERSPLLLCLPSAAVYYLTVAAADNWAGAVCNLGRYLMPVLPLALAFVGLAVARASSRRGAMAVLLVLMAWTGLVALALWRDPHAANDTWELMKKSVFADGNAYVPNLFMMRFRGAGPGLVPRLALWMAGAALLAWWWLREARNEGSSAAKASVGLLAVVLAVAFALERVGDTRREAPYFPVELSADAEAKAFVSGPVVAREDAAVARTGPVRVIVRSPLPRTTQRMLVGGRGLYRLPGQPPLVARASGAFVDLPLESVSDLVDGQGRRESLAQGMLHVDGEVALRFVAPSGNHGTP